MVGKGRVSDLLATLFRAKFLSDSLVGGRKPCVKGRVGVNVSWVFQEWHEMSPEVRDERYAVELKSPIVCRGDVIFNFYFQALRSEKWMDIVVSANLKTASGGR